MSREHVFDAIVSRHDGVENVFSADGRYSLVTSASVCVAWVICLEHITGGSGTGRRQGRGR